MTNSDCALTFDNLPGLVDMAERGKQNNDGFWESNSLVCREVKDDVGLSVILTNDKIRISLDAHHIENKETNRAFHAVVRCNLEWWHAERLRDFLSLLLTWQQKERNSNV